MLTSGVVMPLGAEQTNVLLTPSVSNNRQGMSFAKSFGEMATEASEAPGTTPEAKSVTETPANAMEMLLKAGSNEAAKATNTVAQEALTQSVDEAATEVQSALVQSVGGSVSSKPTVVDETTSGEAQSSSEGINASADANLGASGKPMEPVRDPMSEVQSAGAKIDSMQGSAASKMMQQLPVSDGGPSAVQKKVVVSVEKTGVVKTAKKEMKGKEHSSTAVGDAEKTLGMVVAPALQTAMSAPISGAAPLAAVAEKTAGVDPAAGGEGQLAGVAGAEAAKGSSYGVDRGVSEKNTSGEPKEERTAATASDDDGVAPAKKSETDSLKSMTASASASKWVEEKAHGSGEAGAVTLAQGFSGVTGDAAAIKVRTTTTGGALTAGQDGTDSGMAGVGDGHRTLEATPTALEVGVANGTHGWLKIRAEMADGGVVNASVSATTSAGQQMLHRELPSITAYLQQERIGVGSVVLHTTAVGSRELSGGTESDAGRGQMQHGGGAQEENAQNATVVSDGGDVLFQGGLSGTAEIATPAGYSGGGSWLSVRA